MTNNINPNGVMRMNTYLCLYKNKREIVYADTSYSAQCKAQALFKAKKGYDVQVVLMRKGDQEVIHSTAGL